MILLFDELDDMSVENFETLLRAEGRLIVEAKIPDHWVSLGQHVPHGPVSDFNTAFESVVEDTSCGFPVVVSVQGDTPTITFKSIASLSDNRS